MDAAVSVELFVEILNRYVYYFDQENEAVSYSLNSLQLCLSIQKLTLSLGHNQIPQRSHRTNPLQPLLQRVIHLCREPTTAFPAHTGLHCKPGV
jgi:hypothetical protein